MNARLLASNLGLPEGPVVLADGRLIFCDCNIGELSLFENGSVSTFVRTGGSPWGAVLGADGAVYVTQGGNVPGSGDTSAVSGIQRVREDGTVELLVSEVADHTLYGPNDLAFGPDGRLYFTDCGTEDDDRFDVSSPGRLFAITATRGEMLLELPQAYPNGIAFDAEGTLFWTESLRHRVCRLAGGSATTFCQFSDDYVPDGMAFADDGRLFVCTLISGGVTVLSPEGKMLEQIDLGEPATNCVFAGSTLYVTAARAREIDASQRTGTFWEVDTDATGLDLIPGRL